MWVRWRRSEGTFPPAEEGSQRITMPQTPRVFPSAGEQVQAEGRGASLPQDWGDDVPEPR